MELIRKGYKRTTVYSEARKLRRDLKKNSNDESRDRDIYLAHLMEYAFAWAKDDPERDPYKEWQSMIECAAEQFEEDTGRKPPEDFLAAIPGEPPKLDSSSATHCQPDSFS